MKYTTFTTKTNRILIRCITLFTVLIISYISNSCFKQINVPPVYSEIPDVNFKAYLKKIVPLAFTPDGKFISNHPSVISYNEIMSIRRKNISSLSGIQYFTSLTKLDCMDNQLINLDVSKNTALTNLYCGYNQLTSLDVSKNINLTKLDCYRNKLTSLDLNKNINLKWLDCHWNQINAINLGNNQFLKEINCIYNQLIVIDVSNNTSLNELHCYNNPISTLVINDSTNSLSLYIDNYIKCCHPSIKAFRDRGGDLRDSYFQEIPPFTCL